ncbi:bile acid:sodium symporter family protein [Brachyspira hyodysenteriae]|uniref:bile acid:sodium symporter family protein n=1 Tax=Brachyspira hyodysenteriae TaxID=159 RepID=UPI0022CD6C6B|nr:bile acid:sodium symporter family protein [Brachyspira hyodysenteriae]MCZ9893337.1 bile acid:sodium symporter family protein [Brachyspira hyodysenteriae]MCZ9990881.1 bile acid:sodium symporter family protein [Brachyspira hyodysenteriae]MCZ9999245.1 bile acid:sodium symporter family protein [Brachyspira hyodysenteriae]MDA0001968.1 bile acid:sodium symporter family protein [Brachyspira hyodysenteriae]MDA0007686.1 bile acid:sodium symporter family protein [Brachyspira hyodysenteriae]
MKTLKQISNFFGKYMSVIVLVVAAVSLFFPKSVSFIKTTYVNYLLMTAMFCMGITLKVEDFKVLFTRPKDIAIGAIAQFTIMPLLAFLLSLAFRLPPELAIGVILVGTCPGGISSNVITYLAKGDVPLSVGMTSVSTILAPLATPLLTLLYAGEKIDVNAVSMFISILQVVILPIFLGFIINKFFHKFVDHFKDVLPLISVVAVVAIVAAVVSANSQRLMQVGHLVVIVIIIHNTLGYMLGYFLGKVCKFNNAKCKTISIEVGMQNAGLASSLASTHFAYMALAAVPGAIGSVWHCISGSIVANIMAARTRE